MYTLGIDSGTQSTKAIVVDLESGEIVAQAQEKYDVLPGLPSGHMEQQPDTWTAAVDATVASCMEQLGDRRAAVRGIGVSGQQHGLVVLDAEDRPVRAAKLWCDTSTAAECGEFESAFGGVEGLIARAGNAIPPGFTASKILWLKRHEPEHFAATRSILLPHDYLNLHLTGVKRMEFGDASGTGLLDVRNRTWDDELVRFIDPRVADMLPELGSSNAAHGVLREELRARWGLPEGVLVSAGGGDNMMGAIGTGNTRPGIVTASLGTSGTIYACAAKPVVDPQGEIAAFCDSTNQWLPLLCTMNVTVATELIRRDFKMDHRAFDATVARGVAGSHGLLFLPYLEGERTPNVPDGSGVYFGISGKTFSTECFARGTVEGVTMGMNYGLRRLAKLRVKATQIRATGGGANSPIWRQIMADVFNAEVVTLKVGEGAAYGAALQALWCWRQQAGEKVKISEITDEFVQLNTEETVEPNPANVAIYQELQELQDGLSKSLRPVFAKHRAFVTR